MPRQIYEDCEPGCTPNSLSTNLQAVRVQQHRVPRVSMLFHLLEVLVQIAQRHELNNQGHRLLQDDSQQRYHVLVALRADAVKTDNRPPQSTRPIAHGQLTICIMILASDKNSSLFSAFLSVLSATSIGG